MASDDNSLDGLEEDLPVFSRSNPKGLRVQVLLDADEFLLSKDLSDGCGMSQSSHFRKLLHEERKRLADESLSARLHLINTSHPAHNLHTDDLKNLAVLVKSLIDEGR